MLFSGKFKLQKDCNQSCQSKRVLGLIEIICGKIMLAVAYNGIKKYM